MLTRNADVAEVLIKNGADVNARDKTGHTPLLMTITENAEIAAFLRWGMNNLLLFLLRL